MKIGEGGGADDEQEIEVLELKFDEAIRMIESGEIKDGKTILLLECAQVKRFFELLRNPKWFDFLLIRHILDLPYKPQHLLAQRKQPLHLLRNQMGFLTDSFGGIGGAGVLLVFLLPYLGSFGRNQSILWNVI